MTDNDPHRLPHHTIPSRYDLELAPDLANASFNGRVVIVASTTEAADEFLLNAADLDIAACRVDGEPTDFELDADAERLAIRPASGVEVGDHEIDIEFTGTLNDQLRGWYRSTYVDADGNEQVIATSQMQSTDCRRAFPCWDEPEFKAVFGVTLIVDDGLLAVSNGAEVAREPLDDGRVRVSFADTMVMSSYLVAFVVGPLEATEVVDVDGIPMRIVHVPGKGHLTAFGLEIGAFALRWFQDYYGIAYPADKVDLIALPDFAAGAMENLGCITFRENLLLVDEDTATQAEKQLVTDVVAHELAHMWFGDLVTMRWWNGIWLNEAFATFMELAAADAFRPEWERWITFGLERSAAFEVDSLHSTRPVEFDVTSPADAEGMFDVLTYQKGGALLRMLEQHIGPDEFRAGVSDYLRRHAYGNTETSDLWDAIEETTGEPVRRIMDSWIWQPGYPLVRVEVDNGHITLAQRRFSFDDADVDTDVWAIPMAVRHGDTTDRFLFDAPDTQVDAADDDSAVIVNAGGHGFFRVAYSPELLARFAPDVLASMSTLERYNLVDDAWNAVVAGEVAAVDYLTLIERFADEPAVGVWRSIAIGIRNLRRLIDGDDAAIDALQARVRSLAGPMLDRLGEPDDDESDLDASLRGLLLGLVAVQGNDAAALERARAYYQGWSDDPASVDAELAAAATSIIAATGDGGDYDAFVEQFRSGANPQVQLRHLNALAEFDHADLMRRTCELAMSDAVKSQNAPFLLRNCIGNRSHGEQAWRFVRERWAEANERFPRNTIVRMVGSITTLDRPEQVADVQSFFAEHPIEQATATLAQLLERQRVNAEFRQRERDRLLDDLR